MIYIKTWRTLHSMARNAYFCLWKCIIITASPKTVTDNKKARIFKS